MVDYEQAFKKPFTDLIKLIIGIILSVVPILHWIAKGFAIESSGLGKTKKSSKMPEWGDWWNLFVRGLLSDIIVLIYSLPGIIVLMIGIGLTLGPAMVLFMGSGITPEILEGMGMGENDFTQSMPSVISDILATSMFAMPALLIGVILLLLAFYLSPMAIMNYVKNNKFTAAFDLGLVTKKSLTSKFFITWIVVIIVTAVVAVVFSLIPIVGTMIGSFIMLVVAYSLYGQIYSEIK